MCTSVRWRWRVAEPAAAMVLALLAGTPAARAQLNFDQPALDLDASPALRELDTRLNTDTGGAMTAEWRAIAHRLLRYAREHGENAAPQALLALTIDARADDLAAASTGWDDDTRRAVLAALERAAVADPADLASVERSLRAALARAPLASDAASPCWHPPADPDAAFVALDGPLATLASVTDAAPERALRLALRRPVYTRSAARLVDAANRAEVAAARAWAGPEITTGVRDALRAAWGDLLVDPAAAATELARLEAAARVIDAAEALGPSAEAEAVRSAIARSHLHRQPRGPLLGAARLLEACAPSGRIDPDDPTIIRQLRPRWRAIAGDEARARASTLAALADAFEGTDASTDPAAVAAAGAVRTARDAARTLRRVSDALRDREHAGRIAEPTRASKAMALRLMRALDDTEPAAPMGGDEGADLLERIDSALGSLHTAQRAFAVDAAAPLDGATCTALRTRTAEIETEWLRTWAGREGPSVAEPIEREIAALGALAELVHTARVVRTHTAALNEWPGWQLTPRGRAWLTQQIDQRARAAATRLDTARTEGASVINRDNLGLLTTAQLITALVDRLGLADDTSATQVAGLAELAAGPPLPGLDPLAPARADIAAVCLAIEDLAREGTTKKSREHLRAVLHDRAAAALAVLDAIEPDASSAPPRP